jgi:hypothetical protein
MKTDFGEAAFTIGIFISCWLCVGDPDLLDALIFFLMH